MVDESTGLLVEPDDVPALVEAIRVLLEDPVSRRRMGQLARKRVIQGFTIERSAARLQMLFASI